MPGIDVIMIGSTDLSTIKQLAKILAHQHGKPELPAAIIEWRVVVIDHRVLRIHKPITAHIVP